MSIFNELQRRNVFRVTVAYVISAWLLAQVADLVLDNIVAPDWVMQTILLVLVLGLAPVVFFSWAYEVTPDGIKRESEVDRSQSITYVTGRKLDRTITLVLLLAVAYFAVDKFVLSPAQPVATPAEDRRGNRRNRGHRQYDCGLAVRQHERRRGKRVLLRRTVRGVAQRTREEPGTAGGGANVFLFAERRETRDWRDRPPPERRSRP